jgi:hypothetical protein
MNLNTVEKLVRRYGLVNAMTREQALEIIRLAKKAKNG